MHGTLNESDENRSFPRKRESSESAQPLSPSKRTAAREAAPQTARIPHFPDITPRMRDAMLDALATPAGLLDERRLGFVGERRHQPETIAALVRHGLMWVAQTRPFRRYARLTDAGRYRAAQIVVLTEEAAS